MFLCVMSLVPCVAGWSVSHALRHDVSHDRTRFANAIASAAQEIELLQSSVGIYERLHVQPDVPARHVLLVLPGNPGLAGFYSGFAHALASELQAEVFVLGLAGHVSLRTLRSIEKNTIRQPIHSIEEQVIHYTDVIKPLIRQANNHGRPLTIVAHSIGAWLGIRVLQQLESRSPSISPLPFMLLLMPFLELDLSDSSLRQKHRLLTKAPWLIRVFATIAAPLRLAPTTLRRRLLRPFLGPIDEKYVKLVEEGMLHQGAIRNYLHMGRTEMFSHAVQFEMEPIRKLSHANRVSALYLSQGDKWAPLSMERRLTNEAAVPTTVMENGLHFFPCNREQCHRVTDWVKEQVIARECFPQ